MKAMFRTLVVLLLVVSLAIPASALRPDLVATMHKDLSGKFTIKNFMGADQGLGQEILAEFVQRAGIDPDKAFRMAGLIAELDPTKKDVVFFLYGQFEAAKLVAELKKEIKALKEDKQGDFSRFSIKKGIVLLKDGMMLAAPGNSGLLTDEGSLKEIMGMIDGLPSEQLLRVKLNLPEQIRSMILNKASEKVPPPALELLKGLNGLDISLKEADLRLSLALKDAATVTNIKGMLDGFISMGRMAMDAQEKVIRSKMKEVSAFQLLSGDMLGKANGIALGRKVLDRLVFSANGENLALSVKLPESLRDPKMVLLATSVIGVGAAIAIPNFQKARKKAQEKACYANMRVLEGALEMFAMDKGSSADVTLEILVKEGYLKKLPKCSHGGEYQLGMSDEGAEVECSVHGEIE